MKKKSSIATQKKKSIQKSELIKSLERSFKEVELMRQGKMEKKNIYDLLKEL